MSSTTSDRMVGVLLENRYRVERRLASGGMSQVYVGHDERLDRRVAIKIMNADLAEDPPFLARFTREARAAARVLHPNIVTVHDQGTDDEHGAVYLVMELVDGGTLRDLLRERGHLDVGEALAVLEPMLTGLAAAHSEGLVHRDIKPENILIDTQGRVLIADFGLARAVAESSHTTHSGKTGAVFGTIAYLSPEQVTTGRADARSDVYAVGILLYEMLTGQPPYVGDNAVSVAYRHVNDDVPPPSESASDIPGEVDDLVIAATTRDPLKRPADAGEMLELAQRTRAELGLDDTPTPTVAPPARVATPVGDTGRTEYAAERDADTRQQDDDATQEHPDGDATAHQPPAAPDADEEAADDAVAEVAAEPATRRRRRRWVVPVVILTVLALVAGVGVWWMQWGRWTEVPDFSDARGQQDISELASDAGVDIALGEAQFSEDVAEGAPIEVDPAAGTRVTRGTDVHIVLSKGPERYVLSEALIGTPSDDALAAIDKLVGDRIEVETKTAYSESVAVDGVVGFSPPAGTEMKPGSTVEVTISKGRNPIEIPDVTGQSVDEATKTLTDAGFVPSVSDEKVFSDEVIDTVAQTDPVAGAKAQPDADVTVTLVLSKGPDLVEVPDVVGKSTDEAVSILESAGFDASVTPLVTTPVLHIIAIQSETAGSMLKRGSTVTISEV